jgi:DNA-binding transcriptional LysR family regulator
MKDRLVGMSVFAHVVKARSFSAAATKLGTSTSRVSRQVSALETAMDVKLLHRSTRRLSLTEAGAIFYEHCARIVKEAELAEERMTRAQAEPAGLVKVTVATAFAIRQVVPALADFHQRYPKIQVKLSCSNRRTLDLGDEGFDLGIRIVAFGHGLDGALVARKLAPNRALLCASRAYLDRHRAPRRPDDLASHSCIVFPPTAPKGAWPFRKGRRNYQVPVRGPLVIDETEGVYAALMAGLGMGIVPAYMAAEALRDGRLAHVLSDYEVATESAIYIVYLPNRTLPSRVRAFVDFFVDRFAAVPWERAEAR